MSWRVAKSLETLRHQLNDAFPHRSTAADGGVGDLRHRRSKSDHNPNSKGVVTARDFTHDPRNGLDCHLLAVDLVKSRDKRIKYIIWDSKICSSKVSPWKWRKYKGRNKHTKHLHISVDSQKSLYDSTAKWDLKFVLPPEPEVSNNLPEKPTAEKPSESTPPPSDPTVPVEQSSVKKPASVNSGAISSQKDAEESSAGLLNKLEDYTEKANTVADAGDAFSRVSKNSKAVVGGGFFNSIGIATYGFAQDNPFLTAVCIIAAVSLAIGTMWYFSKSKDRSPNR